VGEQQRESSVAPSRGSRWLRSIWMGAPPAILVCVIVLVSTAPRTFTGYDLAILLLLATGIVARAIDVLRCGGTTASGRPSTPADIDRYALALFLCTMAALVLAHSIVIRLGSG
jgi:hypothetical protein